MGELFHIPQAPGAKLIISLNGGRKLRSLAYAPFGARRGRAVRAKLFISLKRRALTPFAWLRAIRRAARSRRPVCFAARHLIWRRPASCRARESPDHGAVEGGGSARQHRVMQNETPKTSTAAAFGRSSIERRPPELREAVDAAIADGATIDEIADLIRGEGGACSRSAVGRYTKTMRDLIRRQQETDRGIEAWVQALGERTEGRAGLILIETLRTMTLAALADLSGREEPVSTAELARLALVLKRIEGTDKLRLEREQAAAKAARAAPGAGQAAGQAPVRKGLSPEAVAAIREAVEGRPRPPERAVSSAPVDPWSPSESHLIPLNPGESRPENDRDVSRPGPAAPGGLGQSDDVPPCSRHVMAGPARTGSGYPAVHAADHPPTELAARDARNKSGHDEEGGPVGWIASPRTQTAAAYSPSPPTISYPSGAGRSLRSLAWLRAIRRAARSRRPGRFAARFPSVANASSGAARGVCYQGVRAAGPERATARRAEWRVSQANGVSARRLREMKRMKR